MLVGTHRGSRLVSSAIVAAALSLGSASCEFLGLDGLAGGGGVLSLADDGSAGADSPAPGSSEGVEGGTETAAPDSGLDAGVDTAPLGPTPADSAPAEAAIDAAAGDAPATGPEPGPEAAPPDVAAGCTPTSCGARGLCLSGNCVLARRVFVASGTFSGALGGASGADTTCQQVADAANLGGTWMSWISDGTSCPSGRFTEANYAYRLLDGTIIANDWNALVSGTLANPINRDENGNLVTGNVEVWTATNPDGTLNAVGCNGFTSGNHGDNTPAVGIAGNTNGSWTDVYLQFCDRTDHLYCFEQ